MTDPGLKKILLFDTTGKEITRFGNEGRGPGEFVDLTRFLVFQDHFYIGDRSLNRINRYNLAGEFMDNIDYRTHRGSFGEIALTDETSYVSASMGDEGSLIKWFNPVTDSSAFWGTAKGDPYIMGDLSIQNDILKRGEIPPIDINDVKLTSDGTSVYAYLTAHGLLQKYSTEGELLWEKDVNIPVNEFIFEDAVRRAGENNMPGTMASFSYITSFKVLDGDVYILSFPYEGHPRTLLRINEFGTVTGHFHIPEPQRLYFDITVNTKTQTIYLTAPEIGEVHQVKLK
ncbi:MAG TPA: hypothetical protein DCE78_02815 [Bacteroidetes bacterium]|nr:hypothetical protein [Bacteroidota bacterium]